VLGVVDAIDPQRLVCALRQLAGGISECIARLRSGLLDLVADMEAGLDFVEEDIQSRLEQGEILPEPKNDIWFAEATTT